MSWSTSSIAWPSSARRRSSRPELLALLRVEPRGRLVEAQEPRLRDERPRDPDELALPLGELARHRVGDASEPEQLEHRSRSRPSRRSVRETVSPIVRQTEGRCEATRRFSPTERSSNSSIDCHVRASPRRARACGGRPVRSSPSSRTRPSRADEAADRVDEGRLAGAVRADQADEPALADLEVDVDDGVHAAEADRDPRRLQDRAHRPSPVTRTAARRLEVSRRTRGAPRTTSPRGGARWANSRTPTGTGG